MKFRFFSLLFLLLFLLPTNVLAFPSLEIPNLIKDNNYSIDDNGDIFIEDIYIDETLYTEEELSLAQEIENVLSYLDASLSIEENSSTIIAGRKMICDDITGELEAVSCVYSTNLLVNKVISLALSKEGCQYSQAFREAKDIYDCSSFVRRMYQEYSGVYLGSVCTDIARTLADYEVSLSRLEPGDLLYHPGHIVMYIGDGKVIHASNSKPYPQGGVKISNLYYTRWTNAYRPIDYIKDVNGPFAAKSISW